MGRSVAVRGGVIVALMWISLSTVALFFERHARAGGELRPSLPVGISVRCDAGGAACQSANSQAVTAELNKRGFFASQGDEDAALRLNVRVLSRGCTVTSYPFVGPVKTCKATLTMSFSTADRDLIESTEVDASQNDDGSIDGGNIAEGISALIKSGQVRSRGEATLAERQQRQRQAAAADRARDDAQWAEAAAEDCQNPTAIGACAQVSLYLRQRPHGAHAIEATKLLADARPKLALIADNEDWAKSEPERCREPKVSDDCAAVVNYLSRRPTGAHGDEAREIVAAARPKLNAVAAKERERRLAAFESTAGSASPEDAVREASKLRDLEDVPPEDELAIWRRVYTAFLRPVAARGLAAHAVLRSLLSEDSETAGCLAKDSSCPSWIEAPAVAEVFKGYTAVVVKELKESRTRVAKMTASKKLSEAAAAALTKQLETTDANVAICSTMHWAPGIDEACDALRTANVTAREALSAAAPQLAKVRIARTAAAWRKTFGRCRAAQAFYTQFRSLRSCDAACMQIKTKVDLETTELQRFTVSDGELDSATRQALVTECQQAGCPTCP